jgi:hypothetical protein
MSERALRRPHSGKPPRSASHPPLLSSVSEAERAEDRFLDALLAGDLQQLEDVPDGDFLMIEAISRAAIGRHSFIEQCATDCASPTAHSCSNASPDAAPGSTTPSASSTDSRK